MSYLIIDLFMFLIVAGLFGAGALGYVLGRNAEINRNKRQSTRKEAKAVGKTVCGGPL